MKKIIKYFFAFIVLLMASIKAEALEVSKNNLTIEKGSNQDVELYANTEEEIESVTFTLVYSTYDIPANFSVASGFTDKTPNSITHTIVFNEAKSGKILLGVINIKAKNNPIDTVGTVNIHTASAKKSDEETVTLKNQNINIKIENKVEEPKQEEPKKEEVKKEEEPKKEEIDKNLLDKIESKIVKINLKKNVFDYTVAIDEDIEELDLKPIAKNENTKIDISSQKISELKDNKIIITTKNGDTVEVYNIKVNIKKNDEVVIDKEPFKEDKSYKGKWILVSIGLIVALLISMIFSKKK